MATVSAAHSKLSHPNANQSVIEQEQQSPQKKTSYSYSKNKAIQQLATAYDLSAISPSKYGRVN